VSAGRLGAQKKPRWARLFLQTAVIAERQRE
jgi:hypothetical protein